MTSTRPRGLGEPTAEQPERVALPPARPLGTLLLPRVTCPRCQARPRLRVAPALAGVCLGLAPGDLVQTYQCKCGETYIMTAASFVNAWDLRR